MDIFIEEHKQLLHSLVDHDAQFMLIGGYAVIHYGYERTTGDMDIWLQLGDENKDKLLIALKDFGIEDGDIEQLRQMDSQTPYLYFYIGEKPRRIDFVTIINNIKFDDAIKEVNYFPMGGITIPVITIT